MARNSPLILPPPILPGSSRIHGTIAESGSFAAHLSQQKFKLTFSSLLCKMNFCLEVKNSFVCESFRMSGT